MIIIDTSIFTISVAFKINRAHLVSKQTARLNLPCIGTMSPDPRTYYDLRQECLCKQKIKET